MRQFFQVVENSIVNIEFEKSLLEWENFDVKRENRSCVKVPLKVSVKNEANLKDDRKIRYFNRCLLQGIEVLRKKSPICKELEHKEHINKARAILKDDKIVRVQLKAQMPLLTQQFPLNVDFASDEEKLYVKRQEN